jgi:hypothetical protein
MPALTLTDVLATIGALTGVLGLLLQWRLAGAVVKVRVERRVWAHEADKLYLRVVIINSGRQPIQVSRVGFTGPGILRHSLPHRLRRVHNRLKTWRCFQRNSAGHYEGAVDVPFVLSGLSSQAVEFDPDLLSITILRDVTDDRVRPLIELGNGRSKAGPKVLWLGGPDRQ